MKLFQYHSLDGKPIPAIIQLCMDAWRKWCNENSIEYILIEEPRVNTDVYIETASDLVRVKLLSENASVMWADWDSSPNTNFTIPDLTKQWMDDGNYAVLYSPDTSIWKEIDKRFKDYYLTHPKANLERGRMWKIINSCSEYQPMQFEKSMYKHLLYHSL
jgi:hypothetical protein